MGRKPTLKKAEKADLAWYERPLDDRERVVVLGQTSFGKTTWVREQIIPANRRVLVYDPSESSDYVPLCEPVTLDQLENDPNLLARDSFRFVIISQALQAEELGPEIERVAALSRAARDLTLIFEEVGDYCDPQSPIPPAPYVLARLARNGRKQGLALVFVSQAAVEIPAKVRRQSTRIVSFCQSEAPDLDALEKRCGESFVEQLRRWREGDPPAVWSLPALEEKPK